MNTPSPKPRMRKYILWAICILGVGAFLHYYLFPSLGIFQEYGCPPRCPEPRFGPVHKNPKTGELMVPLSYPTDYSIPTHLIGGATHVFVARIIAPIGNTPTSVGPRTQYSAEIIINVKGDLTGTITVDQLGGTINGTPTIVEGSTLPGYFLQPGSTYLLSTRYNNKQDWHTLNPHPSASKLLSSDTTLDHDALSLLGTTDDTVSLLMQSYPSEVLLEADVARGYTQNSFISLSEAKKEEALGKAKEARGRRATPLHAQ